MLPVVARYRAGDHQHWIGGNGRTQLLDQHVQEHDAQAVFANQIHQKTHVAVPFMPCRRHR
ncbi:hypothetical protein [Diaphorobacter sp. J5-51]|uniref:hypothetical protein n=1 Tax=Diaphorobacter sp. J5-51 TaxID=680496 RepID=UPI001F160BB6|nr:hypothetical protein [Diaphorobacter sp. J5-51]